MSTIRRYNRPGRDFVIVSNWFARSKLKARAVKVGLYVLSHDPAYVLRQEGIASAIEMNVDTVRAALRDLEEAGLLVQIEQRNEHGHRVGTEMHVSDVPFSPEELVDLRKLLPGKNPGGKNPGGKFGGHKKTNSNQKTNAPEEPSGGDGASPPLAEVDVDLAQEEPVPQEALFDVERPPKPPRPQGAGDVVAAYVVAYRGHNANREPLKADKGRVGRDAAQILNSGQATVEELLVAATALGGTQWANLGQQLKFGRDGNRAQRPGRAPGMAPALPNEAPVWDELAETHRFDGLDEHLEREFLERMTDV